MIKVNMKKKLLLLFIGACAQILLSHSHLYAKSITITDGSKEEGFVVFTCKTGEENECELKKARGYGDREWLCAEDTDYESKAKSLRKAMFLTCKNLKSKN